MKYLRMFERCAIVSDVTWIREASQLFGAMMKQDRTKSKQAAGLR